MIERKVSYDWLHASQAPSRLVAAINQPELQMAL